MRPSQASGERLPGGMTNCKQIASNETDLNSCHAAGRRVLLVKPWLCPEGERTDGRRVSAGTCERPWAVEGHADLPGGSNSSLGIPSSQTLGL